MVNVLNVEISKILQMHEDGLITRSERNIRLFNMVLTDMNMDAQMQANRMEEIMPMDHVRYVLNGGEKPRSLT